VIECCECCWTEGN